MHRNAATHLPSRAASTLLLIAGLVLAAGGRVVAEPNPDRDAYFGEEHIHTSWSVDAWIIGDR